MANVYEARDTKFRTRRVIVKIVKAEAGAPLSDSKREGLLNEARKTVLAAGENSDYFAHVYDLGYEPDDKLAWFAMEKLPGQTLREALEARKGAVAAEPGMDVKTACGLTIEVLRALEVVHALGMLHGDVKPANVMWTKTGKVKLLDLGLAKFLHLLDENAVVLGGTPRYLAPEVGDADSQDGRVDLFATGLLLYELLTGDLPEGLGQGPAQIWYAHKQGCVPEAARKASIPAFCKEAIARATDPDPQRRYPTAEEFRRDLEAGLADWHGLDPQAPGRTEEVTIGHGPRWRLAALALGLGAILLLGVGIALRREPQPPQPPSPSPVAPAVAYSGECDVYVTERGGTKLDDGAVPVLGGAFDFLQGDDLVHVAAKLLNPQTAYFYVLQIDSRGQAKALFPEDWVPGHLPRTESARAAVRIPEVDEMTMDQGAPPGLEALIWFVRSEPLTPEHNALLWDLFAGKEFGWEQPRAFENDFVSFKDGERTDTRGFNPGVKRVLKDPVSQTGRVLLTLKSRGVAAYSRAMCYPFVVPRAASAQPGKDRR
jgi:serine/threonine protein kinase